MAIDKHKRVRDLEPYLGDIGVQAVGHFFLNWPTESAPAVLAPYKYHYCRTQHGSAYAELSALLLDEEHIIADILGRPYLDEDDHQYLRELGTKCAELIDNIDKE